MTATTMTTATTRQDRLQACLDRLAAVRSALIDTDPDTAVIAETLIIAEGHFTEALADDTYLSRVRADDSCVLMPIVMLALAAGGDDCASVRTMIEEIRVAIVAVNGLTTAANQDHLQDCIDRLAAVRSTLLGLDPEAILADTLLIAEGHLIEALDAETDLQRTLVDDACTLMSVVMLALAAGGGDEHSMVRSVIEEIRVALMAKNA